MSRRHRAEVRKTEPDPVYGSVMISKFINKLMLHGKKTVARKIVYGAIEAFAERVKAENPLQAFEQAIDNAKPSVEVKSRRIGGATYQVPVEVPHNRQISMAVGWIIAHA